MPDIATIRQRFPILGTLIRGKPLAYLDSAASAQKPETVIEGERRFYETQYANVHRGIHQLAEIATTEYETARQKVASFINADPEEVILTSGTTSGINIAARMLIRQCRPGDEIVVSIMEHHSNFVPWQQLAKERGLTLKVIPLTPEHRLDMDAAVELITERTRIVAVAHVSNTLGIVNPIKELANIVHQHRAYLVVDGAQAAPHIALDMHALDTDFYAFSGHKMYGPTGIGVLYGKKAILNLLDPVAWGGEMVREVTAEKTTWNDLPWKHEPGTPNIAGAVGLGHAVDFLKSIGLPEVCEHEKALTAYALERLQEIEGLSIIGPADTQDRIGAISFVLEGMHPHDVAQVLDQEGIAVRAGHHCTQPLHCALGVDASIRASIGAYTTREDIDRLIAGLRKAREVLHE